MKVGIKVTWLAVVVVGVILGSGTVLFGRELVAHPPLVPLGLILVQLAALLLPLYHSRELRVDATSPGRPRAAEQATRSEVRGVGRPPLRG